MSDLVLQGIGVVRGKLTVLRDLNITFAAGRLTAVIGPNGAGKSTLLAVAAGLLAPTHGEVLLGTTPLAKIGRRALAGRRAYLPQRPAVDWPIKVEHMVSLGLIHAQSAFGGLPPSLRPQLERTLESFELIALRDRPATSLSGGELGRAMLARACVGDPEILIVDEPTAGLDPRHAIDAARRLRARADAGCTVVLAIHDMELALRFADDIVALREGRLLAAIDARTAASPELFSEIYGVRTRLLRDAEGVFLRFLE